MPKIRSDFKYNVPVMNDNKNIRTDRKKNPKQDLYEKFKEKERKVAAAKETSEKPEESAETEENS